MAKKFIIINRDKCIGCGACTVASEGKCKFVDGKAWCVKEKLENTEDVVSICPVDAISDTESEQDYDQAKQQYNMKDD